MHSMQHFTAVRQVLEGGAGAAWQSMCGTEMQAYLGLESQAGYQACPCCWQEGRGPAPLWPGFPDS